MKILQVASGDFFSTYGGGQVYVKNIVDEFISEGFDVTVISFCDCKNPEEKQYKSTRIIEFPNIKDISDINYLQKQVEKLNPDVIHTHSHKDLICRIGKTLNIPVVVTSHHGGILCPAGTLLNQEDVICDKLISHNDCLPCVLRNTRTGLKLWYPFVKFIPESNYLKIGNFLRTKRFIPFITPIGTAAAQIQRMREYWSEVSEKCSLMIAPCDAIGEVMVKNGLDKSKLKVLPHGIPLPDNRQEYPEVKDGKLKFYYVGRICYIKGIHILLEAFHKIDNSNIELHLIGGVGNKSEQRYMNQMQQRFKSDSRIIWHGKVDPNQIYDITKDFHISIAPSICMEIYGLNIAESLALGKPVIATRCGGGEMQIEDGKNGWLVEPNNVEDLRDKIEFAIDNKDLLPEISENCSAISIQEHCAELMKIYSSLITK